MTFRVEALKQYVFCPRIIFFYHCWPDVRPITYKMEAGLASQDEEEAREARRSLRVYGLKQGECRYNVSLESERLGLHGIVDMVIRTDDNPLRELELIPVDYKLSERRPGLNLKLQVAAYGALLQETYHLPVKRGFLYAIPLRRAVEIAFTPSLRSQLDQALLAMRDITTKEFMPEPPHQRAKCQPCEFRRFCNDVI